jgi:hypothetical protein
MDSEIMSPPQNHSQPRPDRHGLKPAASPHKIADLINMIG